MSMPSVRWHGCVDDSIECCTDYSDELASDYLGDLIFSSWMWPEVDRVGVRTVRDLALIAGVGGVRTGCLCVQACDG